MIIFQKQISTTNSCSAVLMMQRNWWMTLTLTPEMSKLVFCSVQKKSNERSLANLPDSSARSLRRVRKEVVSPHDALRLLKQPRGDTRSAVRSADYMRQTLRLVQERTHHARRRSLNATGQTRARVARRERELRFHGVCCVSFFPQICSQKRTWPNCLKSADVRPVCGRRSA